MTRVPARTLVILAAGQGTRLRPLTDDTPKCLVDVAGRPILDRLLDHFRGWAERWVVVTGFAAGRLEAHTRRLDLPGELVLHENPAYANANSMHSAYVARRWWEDSEAVAFTNADVLFRADALAGLLSSPEPLSISVDVGPCDAEDMKVLLDEAGRVARVSKELAPDSCAGEFTGVALARGPAVACLRDTMAAMLADPAAVSGAWYDLALDQMARAGEALGCVSLPADTYWEVDTLEDLARARAALK